MNYPFYPRQVVTFQINNDSQHIRIFPDILLVANVAKKCKYDFEIQAQHIAGVENRIPDWLSRTVIDMKYWQYFVEATGGTWVREHVPEDIWKFSCDW